MGSDHNLSHQLPKTWSELGYLWKLFPRNETECGEFAQAFSILPDAHVESVAQRLPETSGRASHRTAGWISIFLEGSTVHIQVGIGHSPHDPTPNHAFDWNPYTQYWIWTIIRCKTQFFKHNNLCVKPYVPRELRRDPSNLTEHGIYIRHCQESNSQSVPPQAVSDPTRPQWQFLYLDRECAQITCQYSMDLFSTHVSVHQR